MRRTTAGWMACALALVVTGPVSELTAGPAGPEAKAARRRWALARMDEMANEALRCRLRFEKRRQVEACEADYARRFREYDEIYLEALRD